MSRDSSNWRRRTTRYNFNGKHRLINNKGLIITNTSRRKPEIRKKRRRKFTNVPIEDVGIRIVNIALKSDIKHVEIKLVRQSRPIACIPVRSTRQKFVKIHPVEKRVLVYVSDKISLNRLVSILKKHINSKKINIEINITGEKESEKKNNGSRDDGTGNRHGHNPGL